MAFCRQLKIFEPYPAISSYTYPFLSYPAKAVHSAHLSTWNAMLTGNDTQPGKLIACSTNEPYIAGNHLYINWYFRLVIDGDHGITISLLLRAKIACPWTQSEMAPSRVAVFKGQLESRNSGTVDGEI